MRKLKINVTDENGILLDSHNITVRDGVSELYVQEVIPNSNILDGCVAELVIGTGGTVWQEQERKR